MTNRVNKKISIGYVKPPILGHNKRGIGIFAQSLLQALKRSGAIDAKEINLKDDKSLFDIIHYPYFDPFFLTLPSQSIKPTVVTVHDLIPFRLAPHYSVGLRGKIKWEIQKRILQNVSHICADSYSSKEDIKRYTEVTDNKISVVYGGVDSIYYSLVAEKTLNAVRKKFDASEKFILYVGDINYNKNIPGLLNAFSRVVAKEKINLLLVGPAFTENTIEFLEIKEKITDLSLGKKVKLVNYVSELELRSLYRLASLYIQPSFAEGFGLSVLEAMASGCPVVSSLETSLKEICGDAVVQVNPYDTVDISKGIMQVLTDNKLRNINIQKGIMQAKQFTWEKAASETLKIYEKILRNY